MSTAPAPASRVPAVALAESTAPENPHKPAPFVTDVDEALDEKSLPTKNVTTEIAEPEAEIKAEDSQASPAADGDGDAEDESKYPSGIKLALLTLGLCTATWVVALDNTIIATASK